MRKPQVEDWLIAACIIIFLLFILYAATGCSSTQQAKHLNIIWHDGDCLFVAEGMTASQAQELVDRWEFKDCEVRVDGSGKSGGKPPMKKE